METLAEKEEFRLSRGEHTYTHTHRAINSELFTTDRGLNAVKWSFAELMATALFRIKWERRYKCCSCSR